MLDNFVEYQRREYCKALPCPIQILLDETEEGSERHSFIRAICKKSCIHTTHEFHQWLIEHGYMVIRPVDQQEK